jgi:hypothetical protein
MARAIIGGIATRYEVAGSGPPILMYAPGGFNAVVESWSTLGIYAKTKIEPPALCRASRFRREALVVPGHDAAHATSAARYLEECLPRSDYWDVAVAQQTEDNVPGRIVDFLGKVKS